ncbi:hypothetical protein PFLmoz3_02656 [Pseudomonas fluorescens]|uniref:Uncharacterized protein n=1 Tax=Pseudomonas fluorescens TaxID=294 RepID=A0A125QII1_PSEFL|nr:hypothetical protein PFLmoz3_02656 [Pseudomonas fluorescens]
MGAHMLDAMGGEGLNGFFGPGLGVFQSNGGLAFAPALDAFKQRTAHVPARLAGGEGGVEVDVGLDKGRYDQVAGGVQVAGHQCGRSGLRSDAGDPAIFQVQIMQAFTVAQAGIDDVHGQVPLG